MKRREFIGLVGGAAAAVPLAARAQGEMRRVGMLWTGLEQVPRNMKMRAIFLNRLRELGYIEGRTIQIAVQPNSAINFARRR
jgi:putative ABC transport system substrate-binding protein